MTLNLKNVVPWGRSFEEYRRMFALTEGDLKKQILGCADGPASFNAELSQAGGSVVSFDPLYRHSVATIRRRIAETVKQIISRTRQMEDQYVWDDRIPNVDTLERVRVHAMDCFLGDFEAGVRQQRYVTAELPNPTLGLYGFDLALCSHFLFLYSDQLSERFHCRSISRLLESAPELRVFPLLDLDGRLSRHLQPTLEFIRSAGHEVSIETVDYEFQKGGNQVLRITRRS